MLVLFVSIEENVKERISLDCLACEIFLLDFYTTTLVIADVTVCDSRVKTARITESGFFVPYPPAFVLLVRVPILRPPPPRRRRPP